MAVQDTINNKDVATGNVSGPASYAAGGFVLDLSATFSTLEFLEMAVTTIGPNLPSFHLEIALNRDATGFAQGKALIKVMRDRYDKATAGNVSGEPGGVSVRAAKFATGETTGSAHTHSIDHDHPITTSSTPVAGGNGVNSGVGGIAIADHTHDVDVAAFAGSTPSDGTHTHDRSFEYDHNHSVTNVQTTSTSVEITAGTDLSGTTWRFLGVGL